MTNRKIDGGRPGQVTASLTSADDVQHLLSGLAVRRNAKGGLIIAAPPETASTVAALFSGLAQLLQAAVPLPKAVVEHDVRGAPASDCRRSGRR